MDTSKLTLRELGKHFGDEVCRNCGERATLDVGCVITGASPGKCGFCKDLTPEQRVAHAETKGFSVGEPE